MKWKNNPFLKPCPVCENQAPEFGCAPCNDDGVVLDESKFWFTKWTQEQHSRSTQSIASVKDSDQQFLGMQYDMDSSSSTIYEIRVHEKRTVYNVDQVTELLSFLGHKADDSSCNCEHDCCACVSSSIRLMSHDGRYWLFREEFLRNI
tara:strand:- start:713 stop:1156 length:444 start_codon:yes stop_codon:yes gene_type:complete